MRPLPQGSIPAHAGEPSFTSSCMGASGVYPRPRGGTVSDSPLLRQIRGLSPPTRGNRETSRGWRRRRRSIPAHAGEPCKQKMIPPPTGVYPRPRGGTPASAISRLTPRGLSPPTRGNPFQRLFGADSVGSIPAHAGEPPQLSRRERRPAVYPRPRGGTALLRAHPAVADGLSPPTRGNRHRGVGVVKWQRSIPAHAGEPETGVFSLQR